MKRKTKVIAAVAITLAALVADPAEAHAAPYCSVLNPYPPSSDSVCAGGTGSYGGTGSWPCSLQMYGCSPVPNTPGTWNPRGYTPCLGEYNGCYR